MVYDWKFKVSVTAQDVGEHFERLEADYGKVTPKIVLDSARQENSLLHPYFEWDDELAAEKYREDQAGGLIRNLIVKVENGKSRPSHVRAFVNIKTQAESAFLSIAQVLSDDRLRAQLLENARRELKSFRDKYANLSELASVFDVIDSLENDK